MSEPRESIHTTWEHLFSEEARKQNHSQEFIQKCLAYASVLRQKNLPVIFNLTHLSKIVDMAGLDANYRTIAHRYSSYKIKKRNGRGLRQIDSPKADLKRIQEWIYHNILLRDSSVRNDVYSFLPEGYNNRGHISIKENASLHVGKSWVMNIDLKDFYGFIRIDHVKAYFKGLGYCNEVVEALAELCCHDYKLPQGAPTSPMLSNIIASELDLKMKQIADHHNASYTRYADDLTFSSNEKETIPLEIIYDAIKECGFRPNYAKTKLRRAGMRQMVTGLTVTHGVNVPKAYRKEVWRELHFLKKFGYESHLKKHHEIIGNNTGFYKQWLLGRIMHIRSINEDCGNRMLEIFNSIITL